MYEIIDMMIVHQSPIYYLSEVPFHNSHTLQDMSFHYAKYYLINKYYLYYYTFYVQTIFIQQNHFKLDI